MMNKAVGYTRISAENYGPEAQLQAIRSSLGPDVTLVETFTDLAVASGSTRPGIQAALDYLEKNQVDALVVHRLDRLVRTATELGALLEHLKSRGVSLHLAAASPHIA